MPTPNAVKPAVIVLPMAAGEWMREGAAIGGQAATDELSLLKVERSVRTANEGGGERIAISYGDKSGRPLRSTPGYFHITLDRDGRRLAVDLAQVARTAVDRADLEALFAKSSLIESTDIVMDPLDGSTHVSFALRSSVEAFAKAELQKGDALLAIEVRPVRK